MNNSWWQDVHAARISYEAQTTTAQYSNAVSLCFSWPAIDTLQGSHLPCFSSALQVSGMPHC
jgi:hypothetical protein